VRHYFDKVILLIIFLSLVPTLIEVIRARREARLSVAAAASQAAGE
jgi:hypothetical protein